MNVGHDIFLRPHANSPSGLCPNTHPSSLLRLVPVQSNPYDFELLLGVRPDPSKEYGGRHITVGKVTVHRQAAKSKDEAMGLARQVMAKCHVGYFKLSDKNSCLGHMDPGEVKCHDEGNWNPESLQKK